jgi:hypothetical protein
MEASVLLQFMYAIDPSEMVTLFARNERPLGVALVRRNDELELLNRAATEALESAPDLGPIIGRTVRRATRCARSSALSTVQSAGDEWTILAIRLPHPIEGGRCSVVIGRRAAPAAPPRA